MFDDAAGSRAGIVDQNVDPSERGVCFLDEAFGVGTAGQVGGDGNDLAAGFLGDFGGGGFERFFPPRADSHVDTFASQRARDRLADAFAGAGDDRFLVFHRQIHGGVSPYSILLGISDHRADNGHAREQSADRQNNRAET